MVAAEGRLQDLPVHKLLLNLGDEAFTGILKVQGSVEDGEMGALKIHFIGGDIVHVASPTRPISSRIGELLTRGSLVSSSDIEEAFEQSKADGTPLGVKLVEGNKIPQQYLDDILCIQFLDDLHDALRWSEGAYVFQRQAVSEIAGGPPSLDPFRLVEVGRQQAKMWGAIRVKVPSLGDCFVKRVKGPIDRDEAEEKGITGQEMKVFSLVHHSRTVGDLALLARLELFEACRSLALLASGGFIERKEFVAPKVLQRQGEDFVERARTALAFYGFTMLLVMVLGGILLGIFLGLRATPEAATDGAPEGVIAASSVDPMRNALTVAQMERIRTAIELYKVRRGDYPARIERLLDLGILSQDDLHYPDYIGTYKYKPTGNTYRLSRPKR